MLEKLMGVTISISESILQGRVNAQPSPSSLYRAGCRSSKKSIRAYCTPARCSYVEGSPPSCARGKLERTSPSNAVRTSLPPVDPDQAPPLQPELRPQ